MLPVMVNLDGFVLTHTYELIHTIDQDKVDAFIPYQQFADAMDLDAPMATCITAGPLYNTEFRYQQHVDTLKAKAKIEAVDAEFGQVFGRSYGGMIEAYCCEDADAILVTLGSVAGTVRCVVDAYREAGKKVGLLKVRCMRPFPAEEVCEVVKNAKAVGVLEKDISFGFEGVVYTDVNSSLKARNMSVPTANYVGGLGGRSISKDDIAKIFDALLAGEVNAECAEFVNLRRDICGSEC